MFFSSCGSVEDNKKLDVPGAGLKKIKRQEAQQFQDANGFIGDVLNYQQTLFAEEETLSSRSILVGRPNISRASQRTKLKNSINLANCEVIQNSPSKKSQTLTVEGEDCHVLSFWMERVTEISSDDEHKQLLESRGTFRPQVKEVDTEILSLEQETQIEKNQKKVFGDLVLFQQIQTSLSGELKNFGPFKYTLESRYQSTHFDMNDPSGEVVEYYRRKDEVNFTKGFQAVLYHKIKKTNTVIEEETFFLNGDPIGKDYYYRMLQDLDGQLKL